METRLGQRRRRGPCGHSRRTGRTIISVSTLEGAYERVAETIDTVGPEREALFLAKLVLLPAKAQDGKDKVLALIGEAAKDLD